jgi:hypothetical protein
MCFVNCSLTKVWLSAFKYHVDAFGPGTRPCARASSSPDSPSCLPFPPACIRIHVNAHACYPDGRNHDVTGKASEFVALGMSRMTLFAPPMAAILPSSRLGAEQACLPPLERRSSAVVG